MRYSERDERRVRRSSILVFVLTVSPYLLWSGGDCAARQSDSQSAAAPRPTQPPPSGSDEEIPYGLRPYRVSLSISTTSSVGGRPFRRERVLSDIQLAVSRMYGRAWQLKIDPAEWLRPGTPRQIAELEIDDLINRDDSGEMLDRYPESQYDKAMFLAVAATTTGFEIIGREYDSRTRELSAAIREFTPDRRHIASLAARLVRDSFRPCLAYLRRYADGAKREYIQLQVQADEIPIPDPTAVQVREGDVLRLFHRFMRRTDPTQLHLLRSLTLNYVRVTAVDETVTRGLVTGPLLTHSARSPFGMRGPHLQQVALRQRPTSRFSRIRLLERSVNSTPLICQRVSVAYKLRHEDNDEWEQLRLVSDRNGEVLIEAHADFSTLWLYVYSGRMLLARIPYAPGLVPVDTIELPDDSIRLSVEGDLQLFRDRLVDSIALREVHFSLAERAADEGHVDEFEQYLEEYEVSETLEDFEASLNLIKSRAENRAKKSGNKTAGRAVENMIKRMQETLNYFFSGEKLLKRRKEIESLRAKVRVNSTT